MQYYEGILYNIHMLEFVYMSWADRDRAAFHEKTWQNSSLRLD